MLYTRQNFTFFLEHGNEISTGHILPWHAFKYLKYILWFSKESEKNEHIINKMWLQNHIEAGNKSSMVSMSMENEICNNI